MSVRIEKNIIELEVPIAGQVASEVYLIGRGRLLDPELFGVPYRDSSALPLIIGELKQALPELDIRTRRFANGVAFRLDQACKAAINAENLDY